MPIGFKHRSHYNKAGLPKKPLTIQQAQALLTENPAMEMYTCHVCRCLHVGHRPYKGGT
jgi:hypothetical protein